MKKNLLDKIHERAREAEDELEVIEQVLERQKCYIDPDALAEMSRYGFNTGREARNE